MDEYGPWPIIVLAATVMVTSSYGCKPIQMKETFLVCFYEATILVKIVLTQR